MLQKLFTAAASSTDIVLRRGTRATFAVAGTYTGTIKLERQDSPGAWTVVATVTDAALTGTIELAPNGPRQTRFRFTATGAMTGTATCTIRAATDPAAFGACGVSTVSTIEAVEGGDTQIHRTVLTLTNAILTLTDDPGVGQAGGVSLYTFPLGDILVLGAVVDCDIALQGAPWLDTATGNLALGTVVTANGAALATTKANILASTAIAALVAQAGPINAQSLAAGVPIGSAGAAAAQVFLNVRINDDAAHVTAEGWVTGTIVLTWINLGDNA